MSNQQTALRLALEALEIAQDNLRPHGDNCFLHDEGEYNRCFCGKDSLSNYLQDVVEKLDAAIKQALAAPVQEPVACVIDGDLYFHHEIDWEDLAYQGHGVELLYTTPLAAPVARHYVDGGHLVYPAAQPTLKPLTDEQILNVARDHYNPHQRPEISFARAIEAKLKEKNT